MVTRKPLPPGHEAASLPYPVTPISTEQPHPFGSQPSQEDVRASRAHLLDDDPDSWGEGQGNTASISEQQLLKPDNIPEALRVGPAGRSNTSSQSSLRPDTASTNPFLRRQAQNVEGKDSSADVWGQAPQTPPISFQAPSPIPSGPHNGKSCKLMATNLPLLTPNPAPVQELSELAVSDSSTNPWQPAIADNPKTQSPPIPTLQTSDSGNNAWFDTPAKQASGNPSSESSQPVLVDIDEPDSPAWDEDEPSPVIHEMPVDNRKESKQILEDQHAWDDDEGHSAKQEHATSSRLEIQDEQSQSAEGWDIVDHGVTATGAQESGIIAADDNPPLPSYQKTQDHAPVLPARRSEEPLIQLEDQPSQQQLSSEQPQRPTIITEAPSASSVAADAPPTPAVQRQKKETYEIKKITWHDVDAEHNPRISPILVQNANGPCPLLALVNALTLSTPANVETALVETLRSREQVSLGLLLDAVFDELMSGRRGDAAQELPDVSDLYSFLITLHTGMNVNPRFFPPAPTKSSIDPRRSMSHVHPSTREESLPGTFEETREMKLYSTFSIPLIHGWLPERDSPAYRALARSAQSYEDSQNLMFNEEVLEEKLHREGLSFEEQATLEDIATIKAFFTSNPTQLTKFGLNTITGSVAPGAVAILFRNDHFSTLYRHPQTLQLLQLVTDMGYAGHEEVVWESLIDVNGENAEFFSGDFRVVGGAPPTPSQATAHESGGNWNSVPDKRSSAIQTSSGHLQTPSSGSNPRNSNSDPPPSPNTEQEDHDLALALQLQEEEEQRHEQEQARRRRETELSQQYIEQSNQGNVPVSRGGGGGGRGSVRNRGSVDGGRGRGPSGRASSAGRGTPPSTASDVRPLIPPRRNNAAPPPSTDPEGDIDAPPPSYEHAATQPAYTPGAGHPQYAPPRPGARPIRPPGTGRRTSTGANPTAARGGPQAMGRGQRGTAGSVAPRVQSQGEVRRERDCVVM
ncbi:hypothetical protein HYFRA_00007413 [Hymenoscyphus fraxineus]|uniref:MINDY deubiquitinase domain-containing protein n=1 Tax=Hymenoscyphus fraxineus TaxID=746836 RepID=A0A9N9KT23_9HELO|nr:hypothetical protein HYFRA_00007413 [Hymenoscyphus fraxineus]